MPQGICSVEGCEGDRERRSWCSAHYQRWLKTGDPEGSSRLPEEERFWTRVDKDGPIPAFAPHLGPCWIWKTYRDQLHRYGHTRIGGKLYKAYHVAYELVVGPRPEGMTLDHLCRVPACVNPAHLEPVPDRENVRRGFGPTAINARKTHCPRGHEYTPENTRTTNTGGRRCLTCARRQKRESRARRALQNGQVEIV